MSEIISWSQILCETDYSTHFKVPGELQCYMWLSEFIALFTKYANTLQDCLIFI